MMSTKKYCNMTYQHATRTARPNATERCLVKIHYFLWQNLKVILTLSCLRALQVLPYTLTV